MDLTPWRDIFYEGDISAVLICFVVFYFQMRMLAFWRILVSVVIHMGGKFTVREKNTFLWSDVCTLCSSHHAVILFTEHFGFYSGFAVKVEKKVLVLPSPFAALILFSRRTFVVQPRSALEKCAWKANRIFTVYSQHLGSETRRLCFSFIQKGRMFFTIIFRNLSFFFLVQCPKKKSRK